MHERKIPEVFNTLTIQCSDAFDADQLTQRLNNDSRVWSAMSVCRIPASAGDNSGCEVRFVLCDGVNETAFLMGLGHDVMRRIK